MQNLNFNQCNSTGNYPTPINTTRAQLLGLFNRNTTIVLNSIPVPTTLNNFQDVNLNCSNRPII